MRYSSGKDVFYLMHEHQMQELLRRAHAGELPDELMMENWVRAEKTDADNPDEEGISMENGTGIILADLDEDEADLEEADEE